jgi:hypothetical protein
MAVFRESRPLMSFAGPFFGDDDEFPRVKRRWDFPWKNRACFPFPLFKTPSGDNIIEILCACPFHQPGYLDDLEIQAAQNLIHRVNREYLQMFEAVEDGPTIAHCPGEYRGAVPGRHDQIPTFFQEFIGFGEVSDRVLDVLNEVEHADDIHLVAAESGRIQKIIGGKRDVFFLQYISSNIVNFKSAETRKALLTANIQEIPGETAYV